MRTPFDQRRADELAGQIDAGNIASPEAQAAAYVRGSFRIETWPQQTTWQRIYEGAVGSSVAEERAPRARVARRLAYALATVALATAVVAGVVLLTGKSNVGPSGPLSSGTAVAHEMLGELRQPGKVTHYVVERDSSSWGQDMPRTIECWIDGEKGVVKSIGSIPGSSDGRQTEAATRVTTIESGGRATIIRQEPNRRADVEITTNFFMPPTLMLSDPMRGGVGRYEQMLRSGQLTLIGTETVRGVATYKLISKFVGVSLFWRMRATTIINARQDDFQPLVIASAMERVSEHAPSDAPTRHPAPDYYRAVTRYLHTEVLDRDSLPTNFFKVRIPPRATVRSEIGYSVEEARHFEPYPIYYAGVSFQGARPRALVSMTGQAIVPGGAHQHFVVLYRNEGQSTFVDSVPGELNLRRLIALDGGDKPQVTKVRLAKGALRGRTATIVRRRFAEVVRGTRVWLLGDPDLYVAGPDCTVMIFGDGSPAQLVDAANSLQRLN